MRNLSNKIQASIKRSNEMLKTRRKLITPLCLKENSSFETKNRALLKSLEILKTLLSFIDFIEKSVIEISRNLIYNFAENTKIIM